MWSERGHTIGFSSVRTHITPPHAHDHTPAHSVSEQALKLARFAYVRAQGNDPASLSRSGTMGATVIKSVASAIERAMKDETFTRLSFDQQEAAAAQLARQCIMGFRTIEALQNAMMNPYTMATQLKSNAMQPQDAYNVFAHIISVHHHADAQDDVDPHAIDSLPLTPPN